MTDSNKDDVEKKEREKKKNEEFRTNDAFSDWKIRRMDHFFSFLTRIVSSSLSLPCHRVTTAIVFSRKYTLQASVTNCLQSTHPKIELSIFNFYADILNNGTHT